MAVRKFIPSKHPRDRFGRFTRSRSAQASPGEKTRAAEVAAALKPKRGVAGTRVGGYLAGIAPAPSRDTVAAYTGGGYVGIHKALRAGKLDDPGVAAMDAAMIALPDDLVVSRRVPAAQFGTVDVDSLVGLKVQDAAYAPTTIGAVRATKGDIRLRIAVPKGTRAAVDPDSGEVILDRNLDMVVAGVDRNPAGSVDVFLTVLPKARNQSRDGDRSAPADDRPDNDGQVRADLMRKRVPELQAMMRERGLKPGRLRKSQLVDALVADELGTDSPSPSSPDVQVVDAVRDVLRQKGLGPSGFADLATVRDRLAGMSRQQQDELLLRLDRERRIHLDPDPVRNELTDKDLDAAIVVGGEPKHLVSVVNPIPGVSEPEQPDAGSEPSVTPNPAAVPDLPPVDADGWQARLQAAERGVNALSAAPQSIARGNTLTAAQTDALAAYQDTFDGHYERINAALRAGDRRDDTTAGLVADIDDAMVSSPLAADVVTYRGVKDGRSMFGDRLDGDLTGMVWREDAYVSTSADETEIRRFSSVSAPASVRMRIMTPAGIEAVDLSPDGSSEQELLLRRGLMMRVVADKGTLGGVRRLDVEVLPVGVQQWPT